MKLEKKIHWMWIRKIWKKILYKKFDYKLTNFIRKTIKCSFSKEKKSKGILPLALLIKLIMKLDIHNI